MRRVTASSRPSSIEPTIEPGRREEAFLMRQTCVANERTNLLKVEHQTQPKKRLGMTRFLDLPYEREVPTTRVETCWGHRRHAFRLQRCSLRLGDDTEDRLGE